MAAQRADARRNYDRVLRAAQSEVAIHGAGISLEQIARTAGLGSATVRRHLPNHRAVLEAVFLAQIEALCAQAVELAGSADAREALLTWANALAKHAASTRGLAVALMQYEAADGNPSHTNICTESLIDAGSPLVRRAVRDGGLNRDVTVADLLTLITGIALVTENHRDSVGEATRLLALTISGLGPRPAGKTGG